MPYVKNSKGKWVYQNPNTRGTTSSTTTTSKTSTTSDAVTQAILNNPGISAEEKAAFADTSKTYDQKVTQAYNDAGISQNTTEQLKNVTVVEIPNTPSPSETVTVDSLGYSVAPELQADFIANLPPVTSKTSTTSSNQSSLSNPTPAASVNQEPVKTITSSVLQPNYVTTNLVPVINQNNMLNSLVGVTTNDKQRTQGTQTNYGVLTYEQLQEQNKRNLNILTANPNDISKKSNNVNQVVNKLNSISKDNDKVVKNIDDIDKMLSKYDKYIKEINGEKVFTGTEKQYKEYSDLFKAREGESTKFNTLQSDYNIQTQKLQSLGGSIDSQGYIKEPTIGVGFFNERQEPISKYSRVTNPLFATGQAIDIVGESIFATSASGWKDILNTGGNLLGMDKDNQGNVILIPEKKTTYNKQVQGTMQWGGAVNTQPSPYIKTDITLGATTSEDVSNFIYKGGSAAVDFGKYAIPYAGQAMFAGETIGRVQEEGGVKSYIKNKPGEAALTGAVILTAGALGTAGYLTKVTGKEIEGGVKYSSKAQDIFGTRISIGNEGVKVLPSEKYLYKIEKQSLVPSQPREFLSLVGKPNVQKQYLDKTVTYYDEISGTSRTVKKGSKTIIKTPKETIFSGSNPYTEAGQVERKKAIDFLNKQGYTEKQSADILRLKQPKVIENVFAGQGQLIQTEDKSIFELTGTMKSNPISIETKGVPSRMGEGKIQFIKSSGEPVEGGKNGIQLFKSTEDVRKASINKRGDYFSKLSQAGKTREVSNILSSTREVPLNELPGVQFNFVKNKKGVVTLEGEGAGLEYLSGRDFTAYKDTSISKVIVPNVRKPNVQKSVVLIEKGEPTIKITDETVIKTTGFQGGGKKSSDQFFEDLYKGESQVQKQKTKQISTGVSGVKRYIPELKPSTSKEIAVLISKEELPSMVGGRGLSSLDFAGTGQYERSEVFGSLKTPSKSDNIFIDFNRISPSVKDNSIDTFKSFTGENSKSNFKESFVFRDIQSTAQQFKQQTKQEQAQQIVQAMKSKFEERNVIKPKVNVPIKTKFMLPIPNAQPSSKKLKDLFGDFKVFVTKKGKEVQLDESFKSLGSARDVLQKELVSTLRAGGGIYSNGRKLTFEEIGLTGNNDFRTSKNNKFLVIEQKSKRLRRGGTGKQIQFFR